MVNQNRYQIVAQLTTQCNAGPSTIVSKQTVQRTLLDMGLHSRRITRLPLLIKHHSQLCLQWGQDIKAETWLNGREYSGQMNHDFSFNTSTVMSGYAVFQVNSCFPLIQQLKNRLVVVVSCFGGRRRSMFLTFLQLCH